MKTGVLQFREAYHSLAAVEQRQLAMFVRTRAVKLRASYQGGLTFDLEPVDDYVNEAFEYCQDEKRPPQLVEHMGNLIGLWMFKVKKCIQEDIRQKARNAKLEHQIGGISAAEPPDDEDAPSRSMRGGPIEPLADDNEAQYWKQQYLFLRKLIDSKSKQERSDLGAALKLIGRDSEGRFHTLVAHPGGADTLKLKPEAIAAELQIPRWRADRLQSSLYQALERIGISTLRALHGRSETTPDNACDDIATTGPRRRGAA